MAPAPAAPRIFVSYARSDGKEIAAELRRRLQDEHGFPLWQDLADMEGGKDWWLQITEAIDHVEFLVLVMTPAALASPSRAQGVALRPPAGQVRDPGDRREGHRLRFAARLDAPRALRRPRRARPVAPLRPHPRGAVQGHARAVHGRGSATSVRPPPARARAARRLAARPDRRGAGRDHRRAQGRRRLRQDHARPRDLPRGERSRTPSTTASSGSPSASSRATSRATSWT